MNSVIALFHFLFLLCCQNAHASPITKGVEDVHIVTTYLPNYATVLISLGALLLCVYFVLGCVCCPNKSIKALSYQNGFPVSRLNENAFENSAEITIFPPQSTVIDLQPVSQFPGFDDKVTFEPLPDILPKNFAVGQSAACSSRPAHFSALLKSKVSLHDWFDDPNSNFPREQLQYLQEIGIGWFGRVIQGEATQICDNEEKTAVIVKILREEASPSEHLHFLHEVRPYRDLKHSNIIKLLGRCLESDPFLLIMEHSISDLKTYLIKQDKKDNFIQDALMLQMISNIASGLRYMHDKGFCHMDLAAHNCFVCSDNSVKIGDYGISFDRWKNDYYCLGDVALPIRWYSPEILRCSETTIETKEITREANVWAFGVVLWEIVELGKLPYEDLNDEEVIQKVLIEKSVQLSPPIFDMICKDEIILVMRECWKPKRYRPSMEKIENYIMQLYTDRLSIKKQELSFEERWNSIQPRITEISSYTGTESSSLKFENDFSTRSDLQNYSSDNEILSSFEMSYDMLPKTGFNGQLSPSLNVLNGSIDELTENDAYLNSISLSCGKYDADTLSNISDKDNFQMEEDKENSHANNLISEQISAAIKDLDLVLASQPDSFKNITSQKTKLVLNEPEVTVKNKEQLAYTLSNESNYLSKSSDLSNISESSFSKSSNFSDHVDHGIKDRCNDLSNYSDVNGNCSSYDNASREHSDIDCTNDPNRHHIENILANDNHDKSNNIFMIGTENLYEIDPECNHVVIEPPVTFSERGDCKLTSIPDIVVHESVSENLEDNNKYEHNNSSTEQNQNPQKKFRFIFKDVAEKVVAEISHQDFSKEIAIDLNESLKKDNRLEPLTSTPVKSSSDSASLSPDFKNIDLSENDGFLCDVAACEQKLDTEKMNHKSENCSSEALRKQDNSNSPAKLDLKNAIPNLANSDSNQEATSKLSEFDPFVTAESSLFSQTGDFSKRNISENSTLNDNDTHVNCTETDITINIFDSDVINCEIPGDIETEQSNISNTVYVSADSSLSKEDYSKALSHVISPPNEYVSSHKELSLSDCENDYLEHSKASETFSPPQAFQDDGLAAVSDSYSESKLSFDQELSTSAECGSSENLDQYLEDDHISQSNISAAKLLETSFPDVASQSFIYENCADFSGNMRPRKNSSNFSISESEQRNSQLYHSDYASDCDQSYDRYKSMKAPIQSYDQMIVEDLDTGEQTVINESYSVCDDYENSGESDEILKINTETDEAIIVDSSEALIGFVPSRSIELLQEFEVIPPLNPSYTLEDEKESSDSMNIDAYNSASASPSPAALKHNSSPYESPEPAYPQPYRNFCLQNEVIEEEITDEIVSPSSFHSSSSYCSNEIFLDEEKMSQSSESAHQGEMFETSVMPSMDHIYVASDDGSKTDVSSSECSPVKQNAVVNAKFRTDAENNHLTDGSQEDVMHSYQPTQSVRWLSDETLDIGGDGHSPIIIEGKEILAGDIMQTCELTAEDITSALSQLEAKGRFHGLTPNHLNVSQSPSPYSSVESSPCRDAVYTPDFESDSEETGSGTSCSSTSGSFECIHNKFKNTVDISRVIYESDKSASSREQSPMKVFSKTWDCHATPTRGVLLTPEKKFNSMRKSVSFHEEDPQVVFEYPPASDSSEDGYPSDENEDFIKNIDYLKYADWDLQVADTDDIENQEILEIEELDSEPYVRRPTYSSSSVGPLDRPMLYTLTAGFSDEDLDLSETVPPVSLNAPSNSPPDGEKSTFLSASEISELIQSHLNSLTDKGNEVETLENAASNVNSMKEGLSASMTSVQESVVSSVDVDDIIIDELLPECEENYEKATVHKEENAKSDIDKLSASDDDEIEEIIVEELSDDESASDSFEYNKENEPILLESNTFSFHEKQRNCETSVEILNNDEVSDPASITRTDLPLSSDFNLLCCPPEVDQSEEKKLTDLSDPDISVANDLKNSNVLESGPNYNDISLIENITKEKTDDTVGSQKTDNDVHVLLIDPASQEKPKKSEETSKGKEHYHFSDDNSTTETSLKSGMSDVSDVHCNLSENPVHAVLQEIDTKQNLINHVNGTHNSEHSIGISCDNISETSQSNFDTVTSKSVGNLFKEVDSTDNKITDASVNEAVLSENSRTPECLLENDLVHAILQSDVSIQTSETVRISESLVSDNSALTNNNLSENSVEENVAQNITQLIDSSSSALTGLSDVVSPLIIVTDEEVSKNTSSSPEDTMTFKSGILVDIANSDATDPPCSSKSVDESQNSAKLSLDVPKIIVTPASESEVDEELEEYLRGQLEHFRSEASAQEDFTVTSEYSCKPFDDVFESYVSADSSDYIEAFNFEFENGNFFEDFIDDYPRDLHTGANDRLYLDDGRQKRSSSLPLMTENISDDGSLTMKSDSSLIYDSSKGITRL